MPEPNRPAALIEDGLANLPFWMLIEQRAVIVMECEACHHVGKWDAETMERRFHRHRGLTLRKIAPLLRCSAPKCGSEWVWISRLHQRGAAAPISSLEGQGETRP
jgi:hypothetical protein